MHVTLLYPGKIPVPPPLYGGTERVIYWLGQALVQLGHQVTLIANERSHIPGVELRPFKNTAASPQAWQELVPDQTDIVHVPGNAAPPRNQPCVLTVHGNGRPGQTFHPNTIFVSRRHALNHGSIHFVHNGINPAEYECQSQREDYAVFLAKARWDVKNLGGAVEVARRAGVELRVLGSRNWPMNLQRWLPPLRGVRYLGMMGGADKRELLARARCLIFPVRWEEPFGLALTESLASGAYVVGTPYGSLPEIITPDVGVLSAQAGELVAAVKSPARFNPETCRRRVLQGGFTHLDMARKYVAYYEKVLATGRLGEANEPAPRTPLDFEANRLLPWTG